MKRERRQTSRAEWEPITSKRPVVRKKIPPPNEADSPRFYRRGMPTGPGRGLKRGEEGSSMTHRRDRNHGGGSCGKGTPILGA